MDVLAAPGLHVYFYVEIPVVQDNLHIRQVLLLPGNPAFFQKQLPQVEGVYMPFLYRHAGPSVQFQGQVMVQDAGEDEMNS